MSDREQTPGDEALVANMKLAYANADCPTPEWWHRMAIGDLSEPEQQRLTSHADCCPACAMERELAQTFETAPRAQLGDFEGARVARHLAQRVENTLGLKGTGSLRKERSRRLGGWAAAAAALVLLGGGLWITGLQRMPEIGAPGDPGVVRGERIELERPVGSLAGSPDELVFRGNGAEVRFEISIERVDGNVVWSQRVTSSPAALPTAVRESLQPAVRYRWRVVAFDSDDREASRSTTEAFWIEPDGEQP